MTTAEFRKRCAALGATDFATAYKMIGLSKSAGHMVWVGKRGVSDRTIARLEAAEKTLPRALSTNEIRAMEPASKIHQSLRAPRARSNFDRGIDWPGVFADLESLGLVRTVKGKPRVTALGLKVNRFYQDGAP